MTESTALTRARAGEEEAFRSLIEPYRRELQLHCYRILGSLQDAEDLLQETLLAAWRGLDKFEGRASMRSWLYRIATNRCLNARRDSGRRALEPRTDLPAPTRMTEPPWLEPYPDVLLEGIADRSPGPDARYETKEAVALAFIHDQPQHKNLPAEQGFVILRSASESLIRHHLCRPSRRNRGAALPVVDQGEEPAPRHRQSAARG